MSASNKPSFERVLKPEGKQFWKASRRYLPASEGAEEGSRKRKSVSTCEPRSSRAWTAEVGVGGRVSAVVVLRRPVGVRVKRVGKRLGRYVSVSQVYSSKMAGLALGLVANTS